MHVVVNTSPLPVYKKYRITSLLCIFETIIGVFNTGITLLEKSTLRKNKKFRVELSLKSVATLTWQPGYKTFLCSNQLSVKFQLLLKAKILTNNENFLA